MVVNVDVHQMLTVSNAGAPSIFVPNAHDDVYAHRPGPRPAGASKPSIAGASILPSNPCHLVSAASGDGVVKLWDLRKTREFVKIHPACKERSGNVGVLGGQDEEGHKGRGVSKMVVSSTGDRVYTLGMDSVLAALFLCLSSSAEISLQHPDVRPPMSRPSFVPVPDLHLPFPRRVVLLRPPCALALRPLHRVRLDRRQRVHLGRFGPVGVGARGGERPPRGNRRGGLDGSGDRDGGSGSEHQEVDV